jgi:hypothetical protein
MAWAEEMCGEGSFVHNHPREVTPKDFYDALYSADALGTRIKAESGV